jgi:hypothetical protein
MSMNISSKLMIAAFCLFFTIPASAAMTSCKINYSLRGWSLFYKETKGNGVITCKNGQRANVSIITKGAGLTLGKSEINKGKGKFSAVKNINETFGAYVVLGGHAGAAKSVEGQVMTKGEVSLVISGKGRGFDLGVALGVFTIRLR